MATIIGRKHELTILEKLHNSDQAEFLALYGRRRVGKTFLIRQFFKDKSIYFELTGIKNAPLQQQLQNFSDAFADTFRTAKSNSHPQNWQQAFTILRREIEKIDPQQKVTIFLDELPWLSSPRSRFLPSLDHVWNRYLSQLPNVTLIVCGSAASWILKKIVNDRGGFYGRLTAQIRLEPYTLLETEEFCKAKGLELERKQIIELYMALGGIPKYLETISRGKSPAQIIQEACFGQNAPLAQEFNRLFSSLFDHAEIHLGIVNALAKKREGLTRDELLKTTKLQSGGGFSRALEELEASGFVSIIPNFGKVKREGQYRLIDEYSFFYLSWIQPILEGGLKGTHEMNWAQTQDSSEYRAWAGYTFEGICLKHVKSIITGLGISGVSVKATGWRHLPSKTSPDDRGAQIDLVIDRADNCINLCEIKYSNTPFVTTQEYAEKLRWKKECFRKATGTRKSLFTTMITPYGATNNAQYLSAVDNQITMDTLFQSSS